MWDLIRDDRERVWERERSGLWFILWMNTSIGPEQTLKQKWRRTELNIFAYSIACVRYSLRHFMRSDFTYTHLQVCIMCLFVFFKNHCDPVDGWAGMERTLTWSDLTWPYRVSLVCVIVQLQSFSRRLREHIQVTHLQWTGGLWV